MRAALFAAVLVLVFAGRVLAQNSVSFDPKTDYPTGNNPYALAVGDLNGDGKPDIVTANYVANTVSVFLGDGSGGFGVKNDFATGTKPVSVAIGDMNADGKPDLVVCDWAAGTVSVLLGNGAGGFGSKADFSAGSLPTSGRLVDLNGDGKLDLVLVCANSNTLSVMLGNGLGSLNAPTTFPTLSGPYSMALGDLNGDGKTDAVVGYFSGTHVSAFLGNGSGGFGARADFTSGASPYTVALGDLNGDGRLDLASANDGAGTISILLGNGNGSFSAPTDYGAGSGPFGIALADVNRDGFVDAIVSNQSSNSISVLRGLGTGTLLSKVDFTTGAQPIRFEVADVNADGGLDLVVADYSASAVSVLLNGAPPTYTVGGRVFDDRNRNGIFDPNGQPTGDAGFGFRTVQRLDSQDNVLATTTTDTLGMFSFAIPCGQPYRVRVVLPDGFVRSNGPEDGIYAGIATTCGGQVVLPDQTMNVPPCMDFSKTYTDFNDFFGTAVDGDGEIDVRIDRLDLIPQAASLAPTEYAWIANTGEGTVSKVSTATGKEVARYYTGPPLDPSASTPDYTYLMPSRTVVDKQGNCWVANRAFWHTASITEIVADGGDDRNGNHGIDTSKDGNNDGKIAGTELLPWGSDEKVVRHYVIGNINDRARALCFDKDENLWVGLNWGKELVQLDPNLGGYPPVMYAQSSIPAGVRPPSLATIPLNNVTYGSSTSPLYPYGLALGANGKIYGVSNTENVTSQRGFEVDPASHAVTKVIQVDGKHQPYGIAVACSPDSVVVWFGDLDTDARGCIRWSPDATTSPSTGWSYSTGGQAPSRGRGITVAGDGRVWMACDGYKGSGSGAAVFNADGSLAQSYPIPTCTGNSNCPNNKITTPVGIAIAKDGGVILVGQSSRNWIKLDPGTGAIVALGLQQVGALPYSYSDFTGSQRSMAADQHGYVVYRTDGNTYGLNWNQVTWHDDTPPSTDMTIKVRASDNLSDFGTSSNLPWRTLTTSGPLSPTIAGRWIETYIRLTRNVASCNPPLVTPDLLDFTVYGVCDTTCYFVGCPHDTVVPCTSAAGAVFNYTPPIVYGACSVNTVVNCYPPPGQFPIGTTYVTCYGPSLCSFSVTVTGDCVTTPTGGCCFGGQCSDLTQGECLSLGGTYLGDDVACGNGCTSTCTAAPAGLRAWWPLDVAPGGVTPNLADPGDPGSLVIPPASDPSGYVSGSYTFNGTTQYISAPSAPSLAMGSGDLSIDAWIRTSRSSGIDPIVDKRDPGTSTVQGYHLYLQDGYPGIQLAVGGQATNFGLSAGNGGPTAFVADGQWHHVAATVKRNVPNGIMIYVDGTPRGTPMNPMSRQGSLDNSMPLLIGKSHPHLGGSTWFSGNIDEVEVFNRRLRADEVANVYGAGAGGKCREGCYVPKVATCCNGSAPTGVTISNYSTSGHTYSWGASASLGPGCTSVVPMTFSPPSGSIYVAAHSSVNVPFAIECSSGIPAGSTACYTVTCFDHDSGKTFSCVGSVRKPRWFCWGWVITGNPVTAGLYGLDQTASIVAHLQVGPSLADGSPSSLHYRIRVEAGETDSLSDMVSINGLPAGSVVVDSTSAPSGSPVDIPVTIAYLAPQPLGDDRVLIEAIDDESGEYVPVAELGIDDIVPASTVAVLPGGGLVVPEVRFLALPNPFNTSTKIRFSLAETQDVKLEIYDLHGRVVRQLMDEEDLPPGVHSVDWDGRDDRRQLLPVGMYFVKLSSEGSARTTKIILRR